MELSAAPATPAAPRAALPATARRHGLFGGAPLFMLEESAERLMRAAPPYGFKFQSHRADELAAKRANATLPAVRAWPSCAVVGSSGTLLHRSLGREIDAHAAVFRVNSAPTKRHAAHAGARTTVRVMASPHAASASTFHEAARFPNATFYVVCDRPYVYSCHNVLYASRKPRWHQVNPLFYAAVRRHTDKRQRAIPLTGVVAVAAAVRQCGTVDVYGLSTMRSPRATCSYYWECRGGKVTGSKSDVWYHSRPGDAAFHDFSGNARTLVRWNASGVIRIRT